MSRSEKIFLAIVVIALVAVVIFRGRNPFVPQPDEVGVSQSNANANLSVGPAYLMYNQPYYFGPDIAPFLPTLTAGAANQIGLAPPPFLKR
jgi:hypothetical protein